MDGAFRYNVHSMTADSEASRHRAEDVYQRVVDLEMKLDNFLLMVGRAGGENEMHQRIQEHEQLMITVPKIETTVDSLADHVIGPRVTDPLTGQYRINGSGEYMRKSKREWTKWVQQAAIQLLTFGAALLIFLNSI